MTTIKKFTEPKALGNGGIRWWLVQIGLAFWSSFLVRALRWLVHQLTCPKPTNKGEKCQKGKICFYLSNSNKCKYIGLRHHIEGIINAVGLGY